ncbi:MAG: FG-GAP repeat domain-containing protein, partial [Phycisphaerales bacterium JB059]
MVRAVWGVCVVAGVGVGSAGGADDDLASYFGFDGRRIVVVDDRLGPVIHEDMNADGRPDLVVVNNSKSRIELQLLRDRARTAEERAAELKANELAPSAWYDRVDVSVSNRVQAIAARDYDRDGDVDLFYTGTSPGEIVTLRNDGGGRFEVVSKRRVRELASQNGIGFGDVLGAAGPELLVGARGKIEVYPVDRRGVLGEPTVLGSSGEIVAQFCEDFDGDGVTDVLGVAPGDDAPLRLWLGSSDGSLGAEVRFEMSPLVEAEPIRFPGRAAASVGVIERGTRRIAFYDLVREGQGERGAERTLHAEVRATPGGSGDFAVADLDGDGLEDVLTLDREGNRVVVMRQRRGRGLGVDEPFGTFRAPRAIDAGAWERSDAPSVFVLSEAEDVVGVSTYEEGRLTFPTPIALKTAGGTPVGMSRFDWNGSPALAVVVKQKRDYHLELHEPGGRVGGVIELEGVRREPGTILAADVDSDGAPELLLLTPGEPMVMVRCSSGDGGLAPTEVLAKEEMPQFGLVQNAGPGNTAMVDIDGDGREELVICESNFVRACTFEGERGWRVIEQLNVPWEGAKLTTLGVAPGGDSASVIVGDAEADLLGVVRFGAEGRPELVDRMRVAGLTLSRLAPGSFLGDGGASVLGVAEEG